MFIQMDDVRKRFKTNNSSFHKGYFDAYNNPKRTAQSMPAKKERINQLLIEGKLDSKTSDFFNGQLLGLKHRQEQNIS